MTTWDYFDNFFTSSPCSTAPRSDYSDSPSSLPWENGRGEATGKPKSQSSTSPQPQTIVFNVSQPLYEIQAPKHAIKSTPVALVKQDPVFLPGTTIGVTHWLAYAMTRGRVRVISRRNGDHTLLQLPTVFAPQTQVIDMAVYGDRLAVVTSGGGFVVWELPEIIINDVPGQLLLCIVPGADADPLHSVKWHPKQADILAVASETRLYLLDLVEAARRFRGEPLPRGELDHISQVFSIHPRLVAFDFDVSRFSFALVTISEDSTLTLWNVHDKSPFWTHRVRGDDLPSSLTFIDDGIVIGRRNGTIFQLLSAIAKDVLSTYRFVSGAKEDPEMFGHVNYDSRIQTLWVANNRRDSLIALKIKFDVSVSPSGELIRRGFFEQVIEFSGLKPTIHFVIISADADPTGDEAYTACVAAKLPPGELALAAFSVHSAGVDQVLVRKEWYESALVGAVAKFPPYTQPQIPSCSPLDVKPTRQIVQPPAVVGGPALVPQQIALPSRLQTPPSEEIEDFFNETVRELRDELAISRRAAMELRAELGALEVNSEKTLSDVLNNAKQNECTLLRVIQCESLYAHGRVYDAAQSLVEITSATTKDLRDSKPFINSLADLTNRCASRLQEIGDEAWTMENNDEALAAYSAALSLSSSLPNTVLMTWTRLTLLHCSPDQVLGASTKFRIPRFRVFRATCDVLEDENRVTEAVEYFQRMLGPFVEDVNSDDERVEWESDFRRRSIEKLVELGKLAMESKKNHESAMGYYATAFCLDPTDINKIIIEYCRARASWLEDEVIQATKDIEADPSSYKGYKRKHAALRRMRRYGEAFTAFKWMLSKLDNSLDPEIRKLRSQYVDTTPLIRGVIEQTIHDIPTVLIEVDTGRLFDRALQVASFLALPIYDELRSSMTTRDSLDYGRIRKEVEAFYQYVMFSHKWEPDEPTFQMLQNSSIGQLPQSPENNKLRGFCDIVRSRRFRWCWCDTCCVNQADKGVQQESVVAMFRWYRRSALTVIHLLGVSSQLQKKGHLWKSIWNTRGWTYQEYVASPVVQFFTEDWKPYLGLDMMNHKESSIVLGEMEQATRIATQELTMLQPGLDRVREKLYIASKRRTTREEDIAYSLFGIFNVAIPVIYGEGNQAVGRLLEYILTRSDNITVLAWTGVSGSHHSYLPIDLTVYDQISPPHVPQSMQTDDMDKMVTTLKASSLDFSMIVPLYERLLNLPSLSLVSGRLKLPGLIFSLTNPSRLSTGDPETGLPIYQATTPNLGDGKVRIVTKDDLSGMKRLLLVHPWIGPLIDEDFLDDDPLFDINTRAMRLVVRLRQPFGGLLLAPQGRLQYRRVAADSFIQVQIRAETSLQALMDCVRTVDVQ